MADLTSPTANGRIEFVWISKTGYSNLATKDNNTAYFVYDTREIYVGSVLVANGTDIWYGTSSTSAGSSDKVVTTSSGDFTLRTGAMVRVKFTNANSYNGTATLNVDGKGAKSIARVGSTTTTRYYWSSGEVIDFVYDGTNFVMSRSGVCTTTYYGLTKLSSSLTSTSEALSATPSAVNKLAQYVISGLPVYSSSSTYSVGDRVRYGSYMYECIQAISTEEAWNSAHWRQMPDLLSMIEEKADSSEIPTKVSDLTNDSGFITDAGVTSFNGSTGAVTYTAPVTSVNGSTGDVSITIPDDKFFPVQVTLTSLTQGTSNKTSTEIAQAVSDGKLPVVVTGYSSATMVAPLTRIDYDAEDGYSAIFTYEDQSAVTTDPAYATMRIYGTTVTLIYKDGYAKKSDIPTKTSDLTNDSGFITSSGVPVATLTSPKMDGISTVGSETAFARGDHVHPTDTSRASAQHSHGYISVDGDIGGSPAAIASGDKLVIYDDSDNKLNKSSLSFGTSSSKYLANNGTWQDIPTKTSDLTNDSNFAVDSSYVHTDNNFTTTLKNKLDGISSGAEANVNADWNATSGDSQILNKPTTLSGYGITDAYSKSQVDGLVSGVLHYKGAKATTSNLPASGNVIGDVWHVTADGSEHAWDGSTWQELGTAVDLSSYYTSSQVDGLLDNKVSVISGKGLSTNDYTTEEKTKLSGIDSGAEENVIETIKVNGAAQTVTNKEVNISVPTTASDVGALSSTTSHASSSTTYGAGTDSNYGHVKLSDATDGTSAAASGGTAASPKAVSDALAAAKSYADSVGGDVKNVWYGTCSTDMSQQTGDRVLAVTLQDGEDFTLSSGNIIVVTFTYGDDSSRSIMNTVSLNVNNTGNAIISYDNGRSAFSPCIWTSNSTMMFVYNGSKWQIISPAAATTERFGNVRLAKGLNEVLTNSVVTFNLYNKTTTPVYAVTFLEINDTQTQIDGINIHLDSVYADSNPKTAILDLSREFLMIANTGSTSATNISTAYTGGISRVTYKSSRSGTESTISYSAGYRVVSDNTAITSWDEDEYLLIFYDGSTFKILGKLGSKAQDEFITDAEIEEITGMSLSYANGQSF